MDYLKFMKTLNYGKLLISIEKSEIKEKDLIVTVKIKNTASVQNIIFPDEEIRLLDDKEIIPLNNYKFENNLDPGQETSGQLLFKIIIKPKKAVIQFGKSTLPKTNTELKI